MKIHLFIYISIFAVVIGISELGAGTQPGALAAAGDTAYRPPVGFVDLDDPDDIVAENRMLKFVSAAVDDNGTVYVAWAFGPYFTPYTEAGTGPFISRGDISSGEFDKCIDLGLFEEGYFPDIDVDSSGTAHIAYCSHDTETNMWNFYYISLDSDNNARNSQTVAEFEYRSSSNLWPTIAVTPNDEVHIVFASPAESGEEDGEEESSNLLYMHGLPDNLSEPETLITLEAEALTCHPVLDSGPDGSLHLVFQGDGIRYMVRDVDGSWREPNGPYGFGRGMRPSVFVDNSGVVHIAYIQFGPRLCYVNNRNGYFPEPSWINESGGTIADDRPGLACDQFGNTYVSWVAGVEHEGRSTYAITMALVDIDGEVVSRGVISDYGAMAIDPCMVGVMSSDYSGDTRIMGLWSGTYPRFSRIQTYY